MDTLTHTSDEDHLKKNLQRLKLTIFKRTKIKFNYAYIKKKHVIDQ